MLSKLYQEKPDNLRIAESLAQFKLQQKEYDAALSIYGDILKVDTDYPEAHFWIGYLYEEKGQRKKAAHPYTSHNSNPFK